MNLFQLLGFPVGSKEDFDRMMKKLESTAQNFTTAHGSYSRLATAAGPEIWLQLSNEGQLIGIEPHYRPTVADFKVSVDRGIPNHQNPLNVNLSCATADDVYDIPLCINVPDFWLGENSLHRGTVINLPLVGYARECYVFNSESDYLASSIYRQAQLGIPALIPTGTFSPDGAPIDPPNPTAILTGTIHSVERKTNPLGGVAFTVLDVTTLGGRISIITDKDVDPNAKVVSATVLLKSFSTSADSLSQSASATGTTAMASTGSGGGTTTLPEAFKSQYAAYLESPLAMQRMLRLIPRDWVRIVFGILCFFVVFTIPVGVYLLFKARSNRRKAASLVLEDEKKFALSSNAEVLLLFGVLVNRTLLEESKQPAPGLFVGSFDPTVSTSDYLSVMEKFKAARGGEGSHEAVQWAQEVESDLDYQPNRRRKVPSTISGNKQMYFFDAVIDPEFLVTGQLKDMPMTPYLVEKGDKGRIRQIPMPQMSLAS